MRILMTVPSYGPQFREDLFLEKISGILGAEDVDLVVFPEGYIDTNSFDELERLGETLSECYNTAILVGVTLYEDNSEWGVYYNIHATEDETTFKLFCKHSTANTIAFQQPDYLELAEGMYEPVYYKGKTIQFNICHDIFLPLLVETLEVEPCDYFINLTGGNVKMSKWKTIFQARSYEYESAFLCTMGYNPEQSQSSSAFSYLNGEEVVPYHTYKTRGSKKACYYYLYDFTHPEELEVYTDKAKMTYSNKEYTDFTVGLDCEEADVTYVSDNRKLDTNDLEYDRGGEIQFFKKDDQVITLYLCKYESLFDSTYIYNYPMDPDFHHILVYETKGVVEEQKAIALAKARAIENRVGVVVIAANIQFGLKTNRYKDIQLFQFNKNKVGFNFQFLNGYHSTFNQANNGQFIGTRQKEMYLALKN